MFGGNYQLKATNYSRAQKCFWLGVFKVVNSREVREVVEGSTCISDKKLSEIC